MQNCDRRANCDNNRKNIHGQAALKNPFKRADKCVNKFKVEMIYNYP